MSRLTDLAQLRKIARMAETDLLATVQVARILRVSVATVNRMAKDGRLEVAHKLPGLRGAQLFARSSVEALREVAA